MARAESRTKLNRRKFLAGVAMAGAAAPAAKAATSVDAPVAPPLPSALRPSAAVAAAETGTPSVAAKAEGMPASDFMVDVIKSLDIAYVPCNPAQSFRGLHESLDQLRRQQEAGIPHLHARGSVRRHGARLFQDRRQAAAGALSRHRRPAARRHGDLQRLVRPRAGDRDGRHRSRRLQAPARRADLPFGAGHQRAGARLHQMGRPAGVAAAFRAVLRARLQAGDDAAARAGDARARLRPAGRNRARPAPSSTIPRYVPTAPPQGDGNAVREAARLLGERGAPRDRRRQMRAHARTA